MIEFDGVELEFCGDGPTEIRFQSVGDYRDFLDLLKRKEREHLGLVHDQARPPQSPLS